jgi:hypothetical protein
MQIHSSKSVIYLLFRGILIEKSSMKHETKIKIF